MSKKSKSDSMPEVSTPALAPGKAQTRKAGAKKRPVEIGGRDGPDPTRYGDWEKNGRCIDF